MGYQTLVETRRAPAQKLARVVLSTFVLAFIITRVWVILIMSRRLPDLYVHVRGTHLHHLNFGIFLLSGVGALLLFGQPAGKQLTATAILYGVGLAWTFDEFGMWLHLGGSYWQRASFDAIVVIAGLLGLIVVAPSLARFRPRHWATAAVLGIAAVLFAGLLIDSLNRVERKLAPRFERLESEQPK